jgi:hypothetical protein
VPNGTYAPATIREAPESSTAENDVVRGIVVHLDTERSSGYALVRDTVPYEMATNMFHQLASLGWAPINDSEAIEPHDYEDGDTGVKA